MPRISKKKQLEESFFINQKGRIEFNRLCRACVNACKQSHKAVILFCRNFKRRENS